MTLLAIPENGCSGATLAVFMEGGGYIERNNKRLMNVGAIIKRWYRMWSEYMNTAIMPHPMTKIKKNSNILIYVMEEEYVIKGYRTIKHRLEY